MNSPAIRNAASAVNTNSVNSPPLDRRLRQPVSNPSLMPPKIMSTTLQPLPNPFMNSEAGPRPRRRSRFAVQPALAAFLICLLLGLVIVGWRASARADDARARAGLEALARGSALELQFNKVVSAAEVLGALARQHGGAIPDFQKVATELLAARPGLASLELQPGGVVSDIVPRAANARVIGFNVLNNPTYRPGALATIQRRVLTVTGPVALYGGELGHRGPGAGLPARP